MIIGENLKRFRKRKGKTQDEFARQLDIKRTTYAAYETGRVGVDMELLQKLSKTYEVSLDELMKEMEESASNQESKVENQKNFTTNYDNLLFKMLDEIRTNLIETRHAAELNQALIKATLNQTGRLEALATEAPLQAVLQRLNEVSVKIFLEMHPELNRTSGE